MTKEEKRLYDIEYRKNNLTKIKLNAKNYYLKNRKRILNHQANYQRTHRVDANRRYREWYARTIKKEGNSIQVYKSKFPWQVVYSSAKNRCLRRKDHSYYKRHIPFKMTIQDFKDLWIRDKAHLMIKPSIDRKISALGYVKSNCRFIEFKMNMSRKRKVS